MAQQSRTSVKRYFQSASSSSPSESSSLETIDPLDAATDSDGSGSDDQSPTLYSPGPAKRRRREKRTFKDEWKVRYLMWPVAGGDGNENQMMCIHCQTTMKARSGTAKRHLQRKHPSSLNLSTERKERLVRQLEKMYSKQKSTMDTALEPDKLVKLAPYKLAFVLGKYKLPFSCCEKFLKFAGAADPTSLVFKQMAGSRDTVTKRSQEIHQSLLKPRLVQAVHNSPFWSLLADESTDSATMEQLGVYVRYLDIETGKLCEDFLEMKQIQGHPTAQNIFKCLMQVLDPENPNLKMPLDKLAGFTSDGASVMISPKNGVLGKLRSVAGVNSKLFSTHCPPHRLVLAAKEGQKELPDDVEKTIADTLFFFKYSPVRREEFKKLKEMVEPDSPYIYIVQYHKVRWLSLADCVSRLVQLLPLLIQYFEEQALDTSNRPAVRSKCQDLHARLSMPKLQLFLYFLHPQLNILASINRWLQSSNLTLHTVYSKIQAFLKTFASPVTLDCNTSVFDENNIRPMEAALQQCPGQDFKKHLVDCSDHALMPERDLNDAKKRMFNFIITVAKALEKRFPDMNFYVENTAFVDPILLENSNRLICKHYVANLRMIMVSILFNLIRKSFSLNYEHTRMAVRLTSSIV